MSHRDPQTPLKHMLDHAREAINMAGSHTRTDLDSDRQLNLALVRLMEIVGEASARVADDIRDQSPDVPWTSIVGLRNRLIHGYDEVDFDILWTIIQDDLPPLIIQLQQMLDGEADTGTSAQ